VTATTTPAVGAEVTERLDRMASQLDVLTAELQRQREQREMWQELTHDLAPIARDAMSSVTAELDELKDTVSTEELLRFTRQLAVALPTIEAALGQLTSLGELASDATTLAGPAMASLTERLAKLEEHGYLGFARSSLGVVDRVMTSFSEDDVEALGDNVVLILETVKEMTQPEIMTMLRRTAHMVNEPEAVPTEPPSLFALLREMRDPEVRRGLARMLALLRSLSDTPES
jgi:uncharacterized protein YjgD (DUF1641 family)